MPSHRRRLTKSAPRSRHSPELIILCSLCVMFAPFLFSTETIDPALPIRFLLLALLNVFFTAWLWVRSGQFIARWDFSVLRRRIFWAAAIYLLVTTLSISRALHSGEALAEMLKSLLMVALFANAT